MTLASQLLLALREIIMVIIKKCDYEINRSALFSIFQNNKKEQVCHLKKTSVHIIEN